MTRPKNKAWIRMDKIFFSQGMLLKSILTTNRKREYHWQYSEIHFLFIYKTNWWLSIKRYQNILYNNYTDEALYQKYGE